MAQARYFLGDAVLTALFALDARDCEGLFAAFDQIADEPENMADAMGRDWDGRIVCLARFGKYEIGYVIGANASVVTFTLLRPGRK